MKRLIKGQSVKFRNADGKRLAGRFVRYGGRFAGRARDLVQVAVHGPTRYAGQWMIKRSEVL